jgi:FixJ family two-component response regulator
MITTNYGIYRTTPRPTADAPVVFVVDGDAAVRASLELLIRDSGWQPCAFASAREFLGSARVRVPSCLVLDLALPGLDGLAVQRQVARERPDMPVLVVTGCADVAVTVQAMKAGAADFLTKPFREDELMDAIGDALERSRRALEYRARVTALHESYERLTRREREVMVLVASGLLNKQVGGELGISEITVKAHRGQVMRKMKADSLPALVHMVTHLELPTAASAARW